MNLEQKIIEIFEHQWSKISTDDLPVDLGEILYQNYSDKVEIDFPSPKTENLWRLKSKGCVGFIALNSSFALRLSPKIKVNKLFQMLEYVYGFEIQVEDKLELIYCDTIESFYERLAYLLSCQILERVKKGLYRAYIEQVEDLSVIRGHINASSFLRNPWNLKISCSYQRYTGNIVDNKILAWALHLIKQSGLCDQSRLSILKAYKALCEVVELSPCSSEVCINRNYNRLNDDYRRLHALCRFFIDSSSASLKQGEYAMVSFLIDMDRLFEMFVASWLKKNLPEKYDLREQDELYISPDMKPSRIDIVIYDEEGKEYCVLDTKYKTKFERDDLYQLDSYASRKNCNEAILVYPVLPDNCPKALFPNQNIQVRILVFSLDNDLEQAGKQFKSALFKL